MKENSEVLCSLYPNPYLVGNKDNSVSLEESAQSQAERNKKGQESGGTSLGKVSNSIVSSFLNFWQQLIHSPQSFPEQDDTPITTYVVQGDSKEEEEEMVRAVLCNLLDLKPNSEALFEAIKATNKIFHEDFPGSYIVEHQGERLGIFFLEIRSLANGTSEVSYEFLPGVKNFNYIF